VTALLIALALSPPDEGHVSRLIEALGAESIDRREAAEQELQRLPDTVVPLLERAKADPDPERRSRVERLLAIRTVDVQLKALAAEAPEGRVTALKALLSMDRGSSSVIRRRGEVIPGASFIAGQAADILERAPAGSLGFGIIVEKPKAALKGEVPGWEVFVNDSDRPVVLETAQDALILIQEGAGGWLAGGRATHQTRKPPTALIHLEPKEVFLKPRNLLVARHRTGNTQGVTLQGPGTWTLVPSYWQWDAADSRWTGKLSGNRVRVEFE
jgi:hypothetical protein